MTYVSRCQVCAPSWCAKLIVKPSDVYRLLPFVQERFMVQNNIH